MPKDSVALPSNGCKIVPILLGKADDLCTTRCEASKGRWQCRDKQVVTKAYWYLDGNVLVEARCEPDHALQLHLTICMYDIVAPI